MSQKEEILFFWKNPVSTNLVKETWEAAFNRSFELNYWEWRFLNNPVSKKVYVGYILKNNVLVSHYAVSPINISLGNNINIKAGLINMAMTHPNYQGQGHLVTIAKALHAELFNDGFSALISFPTRDVTHNIFKKKFNWLDIASINLMTLNNIISEENLLELHNIKINESPINKDILKSVLTLDNDFSFFQVKREVEYLNWRLLENPVNKYSYFSFTKNGQFIGIVICKVYNNELDIMEYYTSTNDKKFRFELLKIISWVLIKKYKKVNIWAIESSIFANELLSLGYIPGNLVTNFGIIPLKEIKGIENASNWHISLIDSDVY